MSDEHDRTGIFNPGDYFFFKKAIINAREGSLRAPIAQGIRWSNYSKGVVQVVELGNASEFPTKSVVETGESPFEEPSLFDTDGPLDEQVFLLVRVAPNFVAAAWNYFNNRQGYIGYAKQGDRSCVFAVGMLRREVEPFQEDIDVLTNGESKYKRVDRDPSLPPPEEEAEAGNQVVEAGPPPGTQATEVVPPEEAQAVPQDPQAPPAPAGRPV